jgi:hypothetical protein
VVCSPHAAKAPVESFVTVVFTMSALADTLQVQATDFGGYHQFESYFQHANFAQCIHMNGIEPEGVTPAQISVPGT